jgi:hypothetical protein
MYNAASLASKELIKQNFIQFWLSKYHFEYKGKPNDSNQYNDKASIFRMPLLIKNNNKSI